MDTKPAEHVVNSLLNVRPKTHMFFRSALWSDARQFFQHGYQGP
jgi:hypothetical protein